MSDEKGRGALADPEPSERKDRQGGPAGPRRRRRILLVIAVLMLALLIAVVLIMRQGERRPDLPQPLPSPGSTGETVERFRWV